MPTWTPLAPRANASRTCSGDVMPPPIQKGVAEIDERIEVDDVALPVLRVARVVDAEGAARRCVVPPALGRSTTKPSTGPLLRLASAAASTWDETMPTNFGRRSASVPRYGVGIEVQERSRVGRSRRPSR